MSDRHRPVTVPIRVEIGNLFRRHMDMSRVDVNRVVIVICFDQSDSGPVGCMGEIMLRLRHAVQVHGRQQGDAQADAEVAEKLRQRFAPAAPVAVEAVIDNGVTKCLAYAQASG
jgi:hypothetical protein